MSINKEFVLEALLCKNYFPRQRETAEELPPIFNSISFTSEVARQIAELQLRKSGYDQIEYKLTRFNNVSRILSIPHPLPYAKLCLSLHDNWEELEYICKNPVSQIKPISHEDGRLFIMNRYSSSPAEKAKLHLDYSFGNKYIVETDIANCFHSIYSHAVPWALVGFDKAKAEKSNKNTWFNKIDEHLRACCRNETQGIAIGTGTSSIIAEIILAKVDAELVNAKFSFVRYIDDYFCYCESQEKAESFIRALESELSKYKLRLNINKTKISELPQPINPVWKIELGKILSNQEKVKVNQAFQFLDLALDLSKKHPNESILKYAAKVITSKEIEQLGYLDVLNYLLTLTFRNPELLPVIHKLITKSCTYLNGHQIDWHQTIPKLTRVLEENIRLKQSDGICWCLYYLKRLNVDISEELANNIVETKDVLSILTLFWTGQHIELVTEFCHTLLTRNDLFEKDCYWVLLYQLFRVGNIKKNPYTNEDARAFNILKSKKVNFLYSIKQITMLEDAGIIKTTETGEVAHEDK